ncbi:ATP-binding protein [Ponticoccus sp. (in: a-proteobacteria)]|uniref:hybrid sensor histidine kinase/response regulator n=1 Tax=Ponticoccus sp. (in: a-proteobacteria) TaxID=1925025 RepID=UPI003AB37272
MQRKINVGFAENYIVRRGLTAFVVSLFVTTIGVLVMDVSQQMGWLSSSSSDNMQWTLGQTETELAALELATYAAMAEDSASGAGLEEVRLRFNVFYSRVQTITDSTLFRGLRSVPEVQAQLDEILAWRDSWVPVIDGPDTRLAAQLPRLQTESAQMRGVVRKTALDGIAYYARFDDTRRTSIFSTLLRIGVLTLALVVLLLVLILMLVRLGRQRELSAQSNREMRERLETIISTSLDAILVVDRAGRIVEYNGAAERIFGRRRDLAIGADMAALLLPYGAALAPFLATGSGTRQAEARRRDGSLFPVDVSSARAHSPGGEIFVIFLRDISTRVSDEEALREARDRAIAGERQKADLLAVMSHEMRTPLNGMLGSLELFEGDNLNARQKRFLRIVRNSGKVLLNHVNDVLDISRLDAGKMTLRKRRFDLVALMEEIVENQAERARAQGNRIVLAPSDPALHTVYSDPDRLRQILLNLVGNAVKFTRNGTITLEVDCDGGLDAVEFRVIDTGIGIPEADLDRIFDDFVTIDSSYARRTTGTGLGLGISRRLARALGGDLGAESEAGEGSVFWLHLPMALPGESHAPQATAPVRPPKAERLPPLRVLVVEDNEINRLVAREFLHRGGHKVTEAPGGAEGVAEAAKTRFDVILMDISMPGMNGIEAARAIREGGGLSANVPIIATTAHALAEERRAFDEAGMVGVLVKPISAASVREALAEALSGRPLSVGATATRDAPVLDRAHLAELQADLPAARLAALLATFRAEMTSFLEGMVPQTDRAALAAEAHRMAGSAGVFGAMQLTQRLREAQVFVPEASPDELTELRAALTACWTAAEAALRDVTEPPQRRAV